MIRLYTSFRYQYEILKIHQKIFLHQDITRVAFPVMPFDVSQVFCRRAGTMHDRLTSTL